MGMIVSKRQTSAAKLQHSISDPTSSTSSSTHQPESDMLRTSRIADELVIDSCGDLNKENSSNNNADCNSNHIINNSDSHSQWACQCHRGKQVCMVHNEEFMKYYRERRKSFDGTRPRRRSTGSTSSPLEAIARQKNAIRIEEEVRSESLKRQLTSNSHLLSNSRSTNKNKNRDNNNSNHSSSKSNKNNNNARNITKTRKLSLDSQSAQLPVLRESMNSSNFNHRLPSLVE